MQPGVIVSSMRRGDLISSGVTEFFNFGVKIESKSSPKAKLELTAGDWVDPWNLIMAQDTGSEKGVPDDVVDKYVSRYVQSRSISPPYWQNLLPTTCTLYSKSDDFATFLGSSTLDYMTLVQTNYSIANEMATQSDPYAPYLQTCNQ